MNASTPWRSWFDDHRVATDHPPLRPRLRPDEEEILAAMRPATTELLAARKLLRRIDTKVIFPRAELVHVLRAMADRFDVVQSEGLPLGNYQSVYFDSPDRLCFHDHRRGVRPRYKVRIRHYVERRLGFVETKTKDKYRVTTKARLPKTWDEWDFTAEDLAFARAVVGPLDLAPVVRIEFPRMTLVCRDVNERLTLDLGVSYQWAGVRIDLPDMCVGEIKQERFRPRTPGMLAFRGRLIRPQRISKYCTSMSLLEPGLPPHRFRKPLREMRRQSRG